MLQPLAIISVFTLTLVILHATIGRFVSQIVFLSILFLLFHLISTIMTRAMPTKDGLININESSVFGATLVGIFGVGLYVFIKTILPNASSYVHGIMTAIPLYMIQSLNQSIIKKL